MSRAKEKLKTPTGTAPNIIRKSEILTQAGDVRVRSNASPKNARPQQVYNGNEAEQYQVESPIKKRQKPSINKTQDQESRSLPAVNIQSMNQQNINAHHQNMQPLPTIKRNESSKSSSQLSFAGNILQQQALEMKKIVKIKNKQSIQQQAIEKVMLLEQQNQKMKKNLQVSKHVKNQKSLSVVEQNTKNSYLKARNALEIEQLQYLQAQGKRDLQNLQYNGKQHQPFNLELTFLKNQEKISSTPSSSNKKKIPQRIDQEPARISQQHNSLNQQTEYGQFEQKLRSPQTYKVNITNITNNNVPYIPDQWLTQASLDNPNVYHNSFDQTTNSSRHFQPQDDSGLTTNL